MFVFFHLDLLSASRIEFDAAPASGEEGKTIFSDDQKAALEAKFRRKKYPTRNEKVKLASKLGLAIQKVQVNMSKSIDSFLFVNNASFEKRKVLRSIGQLNLHKSQQVV